MPPLDRTCAGWGGYGYGGGGYGYGGGGGGNNYGYGGGYGGHNYGNYGYGSWGGAASVPSESPSYVPTYAPSATPSIQPTTTAPTPLAYTLSVISSAFVMDGVSSDVLDRRRGRQLRSTGDDDASWAIKRSLVSVISTIDRVQQVTDVEAEKYEDDSGDTTLITWTAEIILDATEYSSPSALLAATKDDMSKAVEKNTLNARLTKYGKGTSIEDASVNNDASLVALEEHMSLEVDSRCYTADGVPCPEDAETSHLATVAIAIAVVAVMFTCCAVTAGVLLCVLHRKSMATSPTHNSIRPAQTATNPNFVPQQQQQGAVRLK